MIDGIKSAHPYLQPETWQRSPLLGMSVTVDMQTGEILNDVQRAVYRGLRFEIRPLANGKGHICLLNGSLHKYYNGGEHNAGDFPFAWVVAVIGELAVKFGIIPAQATLHGLEIGVNIKLPCSPLRVLNQVLCYRNKLFTQIDKRNKRLGLICCLYDFDIKLYDKQAQSGQPCGYVLRFELKIKKMRYLRPYGISTMADLTDINKVYSLLDLLTDTLQNIVFFDHSIDRERLTKRELNQYLTLGNPVYWQGMSKYQLTRNRQRLNDLLTKYSKQQLKPLLYGLILENWQGLFNDPPEAKNLQPFHRLAGPNDAYPNATFSHLEYKGAKVAGIVNNSIQENEQKNCAKNAPRFCKSCGRDISAQRPGSMFCSERLYSRSAKACRNKDSNRRRDLKRVVAKATRLEQAITITYRIGGRTCTDTLVPADLELTRAWLDRISRIEIVPTRKGKSPETREGRRA